MAQLMEENKIIDFLRAHGAKLCIALLVVIASVYFLEKKTASKVRDSKKDFILMHHLFEGVPEGEHLPLEAIETAETILSHHPELHPNYDSLLALSFFGQENSAKAIAYGNSMIGRTEKLALSYYPLLARASLLIVDHDYVNALKSALALEEALKADSAHELLRAYNLLRIAFLAKTIKDPTLAGQAWKSVQELPSFALISPLFEQGSYSLNNYFELEI